MRAIGLLNMRAIPPHLGEIYLSWYYHEQNYHLDDEVDRAEVEVQ